MTAGLRALMRGVIDYAGLFAPAKLPLEEAVAEYLAIRESEDAWMLDRFVIPASRLEELEPWAANLLSLQRQLRISLTGRVSESLGQFVENLHADLDSLKKVINAWSIPVPAVIWELRLPSRIHENEIEDAFQVIETTVKHVEAAIEVRGYYFEMPLTLVNEPFIRRLIGLSKAALKIRTGGLSSEDFPSVQDVASVIHLCQRDKCFWKATAGLHHPIRHTDAKLGVKMHGFLNVLFAAVLAKAHSLPENGIVDIIADETAANFQITNDGIRWRDYAANIEQIEAARRETFQSFGSCSFDEPRDDLRNLGLL